jgi:phospholipase C
MSKMTGKIEHVVVVMLENRGFDTVLGHLYGDGDMPEHEIPPGGDPSFAGLRLIDRSALANAGTHGGEAICQQPVPGVRATNSTGWDPGEEYKHVNAQVFDIDPTNAPPAGAPATMMGFVRDYATQCGGDADAVRQIMHTYTPADLPVLNALAKGYAVSDAWFASVPTQTNANRAFSLCGTSDGLVDNGYLTTDVVSQKLANDRFDVATLWNVLADHGIGDWAVFWQDEYPPLIGGGRPYTRNLFPRFELIPDIDSKFHKMADFYTMAEGGTLPAFSYIEPSWGGYVFGLSVMGNEYHPPSDVTPAEHLLTQIYTSLRTNVAAWNTTLLLIMFDEHGGTYDHVPPPAAVPPWGDGPPTVSKGLQYDFDFRRLGVRVPAIVVSPLIEAKTVFRSSGAQPFDHTSMIATVLEWMLPADVERSAWNLGARVDGAPTFDALVTRSDPRTDDALAAPPPVSDAIHYGDSVVLLHMDGPQAISTAYAGAFDYFPTLATGAPQRLDFRHGYGVMQDGDIVQLRTAEYLEPFTRISPGVFAGIRNFLGAWHSEHDCYYYSADDAKDYQEEYWTVRRIGRTGGPIQVGDRIQLLNQCFAGQVLCADGTYLTTKSGSSEYWTVHRAAGVASES